VWGSPARAVVRHALRGERVRLGVIALIAVLYTLANVIGYAQAYPTLASRVQFARAFSDNIALRLFYGVPHDLTTVGGFFEFRAMGMLAILVSAWALFAAIAWFLYKTRAGLVLRSIGEAPESAHAIGYPVIRIRYLATLFGGAMAGLGGAYLSEFYAPLWVEGMTAGRGWIALALVVFATWRPARVMIGAYLFGGVTIAQFFAQGAGISIASQFLSSLPYLATIVVLVFISRNLATIRLNAPVSLAKSYRPD